MSRALRGRTAMKGHNAMHVHLDTDVHILPDLALVVVRMQTRPLAGVPDVTYEREPVPLYTQFVVVDASFSGFIVRFSRSTVPPCARTGLPNERQGTLIPDFYGVSVHLELPAFQFWSGESDYVAATGSVRGDSLVGKWMSRDSTCAGDGDELFVMSPRH